MGRGALIPRSFVLTSLRLPPHTASLRQGFLLLPLLSSGLRRKTVCGRALVRLSRRSFFPRRRRDATYGAAGRLCRRRVELLLGKTRHRSRWRLVARCSRNGVLMRRLRLRWMKIRRGTRRWSHIRGHWRRRLGASRHGHHLPREVSEPRMGERGLPSDDTGPQLQVADAALEVPVGGPTRAPDEHLRPRLVPGRVARGQLAEDHSLAQQANAAARADRQEVSMRLVQADRSMYDQPFSAAATINVDDEGPAPLEVRDGHIVRCGAGAEVDDPTPILQRPPTCDEGHADGAAELSSEAHWRAP
mmetsp:Transcript_46748/g.134645  ORF Transcript_46748/g.134645 Transcript_46748/m.134645 type:complete len:303 (-) Transcript_46748:241-1149(-)